MPDGLNQLLSSLFVDQFTVTVSNNHIIGQASLNGTPCHIIGIANSAPIAIDDANILSRHIINIVENHPKQAILVLVDSASQNMSKRDELLGLNQYLSQLAKALIFASLNGHVTIGVLYGHSAAGAFIASALATQSLIALPDAYPAVMDLPSMARVTKLSIDQLTEMAKATPVFAPGLLNLYKTGGIDEIWPNDGNVDIKAQKLLSLYQSLEGQRPHDKRAQLGLERGGRLKTLPLSNAVIKLANYDG
ncbi:biotin-independent malonate decarboxylase subunit gamma [Bartonella sp. HY406]|nr:biotin-independent malonate decarboxylase subunit gamma [Bartonella sp. HY406]UXN04835.1 biotin-independent malonate decarboxylase subunit gamma [Bartonella sp. HY406]